MGGWSPLAFAVSLKKLRSVEDRSLRRCLGFGRGRLRRDSEQRDATGARQAAPLRHSLLSASTGSFLLAALEGMRPAKKVRNTLMPTSTRAACHGSAATFATLNSA